MIKEFSNYIFIALAIILFACRKDDAPGKADLIAKKWKIVSVTQHHFAEEQIVDTVKRYPSASYIEFLRENIYFSEDLESIQFFAREGNENVNPNYTGGGIWTPVHDFKYLYLDKGLGEHPIFLEIISIDEAQLRLKLEIDEKHFSKQDSSAFKFAFIGGLIDGSQVLTSGDTTSNGAFLTGYKCGKAYVLYNYGNKKDTNAEFAYWAGFHTGFAAYQRGLQDTYDQKFYQGYDSGYLSWKSEADSLANLNRTYTYDMVLSTEY